ncbi:pyridoxal phosphate-dependent decarboxylase family protein [Desulfobulbus alkaliphilus]|uniref:pyridoxal phosphate-dependent decarboxylase family protein n=1 Tax=Desulfobulbus alkaliphilus TaxID=869814 RepID=UPI0019640EEF|nr:pyridoxal-dependent decarboxylase [Desulfobulbus alkaliphilus]MBM9537043.1 pyridoxal-dependent decarboxylase [Desulfobulbus alkaliphilus]
MEQEKIFERLLQILNRYYHERETGNFVTYLDPEVLRRELHFEDSAGNQDWEEIFSWVEQYLAHAVKTSHPGFVNRMWAGANLPSVIGEIITAITNTSACTFETAPVSTLMEKYMLRTMLDLVGFTNGSGQMTTGSSNANMIAMMAARNRTDPVIKQSGLFRQRELFAFVNQDAHYSMDRAANILGLGTDHLIKIPLDDHGRMHVPTLQKSMEEIAAAGGTPFFVGATAGTTVRGSFDLLEPLLALRQRHGFWLHVDGAWGGAVIFSDRLRSRFLPHLNRADSFTLDFHKMLGTALMCNVLLFNNELSLFREVCSAGDESYIFREGPDHEVRDLGTLSLQCGRRVDSLKWFLDWRFYGQAGLAHRVEHYLELCRYAEEWIRRSDVLEMVVPRESFNICFRFRTPQGWPSGSLNCELRDRMHRRGVTLVGTGYVNGEVTLRLLITNLNVDKPELDSFFQTVIATGRELLAEGRTVPSTQDRYAEHK